MTVGIFFGHPAAGTLLSGESRFSVPLRVEVPLVTNKRRASLDLSRRGTKLAVMICVPTVLTFHDCHGFGVSRSSPVTFRTEHDTSEGSNQAIMETETAASKQKMIFVCSCWHKRSCFGAKDYSRRSTFIVNLPL